jgi:hypothetical protein
MMMLKVATREKGKAVYTSYSEIPITPTQAQRDEFISALKGPVITVPDSMNGDSCSGIYKRAFAGAQALCERHQKNVELLSAGDVYDFLVSDCGHWSRRQIKYYLQLNLMLVSSRNSDFRTSSLSDMTLFRLNTGMKSALNRRINYVRVIENGLASGQIIEKDNNDPDYGYWHHLKYYCSYEVVRTGQVIPGEESLRGYPEIKYTYKR